MNTGRTFVMSDLHGCYEKYIKMLRLINFSDSEKLFVPRDVIDRSPEPLRILKDFMKRKNVELLIGNHELFAMEIARIIL